MILSEKKRISSGARMLSLLTALTLGFLPSASLAATCEDAPEGGFICADSLPALPMWRLARLKCKQGCYLFPPERAKAARFDAERVELHKQRRLLTEALRINLTDLRINLKDTQSLTREIQGQRDLFSVDVAVLKKAVGDRDAYAASLQRRLDASYSLGDMFTSFSAGAGVTLLVGLVLASYALAVK